MTASDSSEVRTRFAPPLGAAWVAIAAFTWVGFGTIARGQDFVRLEHASFSEPVLRAEVIPSSSPAARGMIAASPPPQHIGRTIVADEADWGETRFLLLGARGRNDCGGDAMRSDQALLALRLDTTGAESFTQFQQVLSIGGFRCRRTHGANAVFHNDRMLVATEDVVLISRPVAGLVYISGSGFVLAYDLRSKSLPSFVQGASLIGVFEDDGRAIVTMDSGAIGVFDPWRRSVITASFEPASRLTLGEPGFTVELNYEVGQSGGSHRTSFRLGGAVQARRGQFELRYVGFPDFRYDGAWVAMSRSQTVRLNARGLISGSLQPPELAFGLMTEAALDRLRPNAPSPTVPIRRGCKYSSGSECWTIQFQESPDE